MSGCLRATASFRVQRAACIPARFAARRDLVFFCPGFTALVFSLRSVFLGTTISTTRFGSFCALVTTTCLLLGCPSFTSRLSRRTFLRMNEYLTDEDEKKSAKACA